MIAEWFYPKDLKEIIRDLEAEDNLRREPLEELNKELRLMLFMTLFSIFIAWFNGTIIDLLFVPLFIVVVLYIFINTKMDKFKAYIYGTQEQGKVIQVSYAYFKNTIIRVSRLSDDASLKLNRLGLLVKAEHGLQVGKDIFFYEIEGSSILPMPDIHVVKKYYCLRKDLMDQTSTSP